MIGPDVRVVSFDLGGTLIREGRGPATGQIAEVLGVSLAEMRTYFGRYAKRQRMSPSELATRLVADFDRPGGRAGAAATLERLIERQRSATPRPVLYPGVLDVLRVLRDRGYRIAYLSNVLGAIAPDDLSHPLYAMADAVLFSCDTGWVKPERAAFAGVEAALDVCGDRVVHVGDSVGADIDGALDAGWHAIHLRHPGRPGHPGAPAITDLRHLLRLLPAAPTHRPRTQGGLIG
jgi:putative hydrolase of the HAD superfamily